MERLHLGRTLMKRLACEAVENQARLLLFWNWFPEEWMALVIS